MTGARGQARDGARRILVWTLVLFVASVLYTEIGVFVETHSVTVPLMNLLNDPSLYPGDRFAAQLGSYPSGLWHVVALPARVVPMGTLLVVLLLAERFFVLYAAGRFARALAPGSELARVGTIALFAFAVHTLLGSGTVVERYFEHSGLAVGFILLAMAAFHESRAISWAIWTALAFNCTTMAGAFALSYFGAVFLVDPEYRRQWIRWLKVLVLLLVLSVYPILLGFRAMGHPLEDKEAWLAVSRFRSWWHLYPLEWSSIRFVQAGALLGMLVLYVWLSRDATARLRRHALVWSGVAAIWFALAWIGAYVIVTPRILLLQPARATDLWVCFSAVAIMAIGAKGVERMQPARAATRSGTRTKSDGAARSADEEIGNAGASAGASGVDSHDGVVVSGVDSHDGAAARARSDSPRLPGDLRARLGAILVVGPFLLWAPTGWTVAAVSLAALAIPSVWRILLDGGSPRRLALLLSMWVCIVATLEFADRVGSKGLVDGILDRPEPNVREIAAWARASTPRDAVFFVDPGGEGDWDHFRGLSERGILTHWADGTALNWAPNFAVEWAQRLAILGFDVKDETYDRDYSTLNDVFADLRDVDVEGIRKKVPIRYWVIPSSKPTGFPSVYRSRSWKVVDLQGELVLD